MSSLAHAADQSPLYRVRARVTRLMHLTRERDMARCISPGDTSQPLPAVRTDASDLRHLADPLRALQAAMEENNELIRQGWNLAVDLNQIRRLCCQCEAAAALCEAIASYQGLLNRWRHTEQAASRAIGNMRMVTERLRSRTMEPG